MPREYIDLEPYKNEIVALFSNDNTIDAIALHLRTRHQLQVQSRTIKRRLRAWGVRKLNPATTTDSALHDRIKVLFFEASLEEDEMLAALTADGYQITACILKRIRHKLGLLRRTNPTLAQQQVDEIVDALKAELERGIIQGYGIDSFSLYECLVKLGTTNEKRLMIDLMTIRQAYKRREISDVIWIKGDHNPADTMTKHDGNKALKRIIDSNKLHMEMAGWVERESTLGYACITKAI
ncbi:hypothetical protein V8E54_009783 [Elaphomyces granulatus]